MTKLQKIRALLLVRRSQLSSILRTTDSNYADPLDLDTAAYDMLTLEAEIQRLEYLERAYLN